MATPTQARTRARLGLILGAAFAALALGAVARADDISNNLDPTIDAVAEAMPLTVGGAAGTTNLYVQPRGGDGKPGCNLTGSAQLVISLASNNTAVATVSPSQITFGSCGDTPVVTVTPVAQGSATISASQVSNNTGGTFNLAPVTFTVNVAPPPNTAPAVSISGVIGGASYDEGSVPTAMCDVTDAEDGNSSFPATLSAVSGPYASDGIGEQTASCSYTDGGGLTAAASLSYFIVDPSAPAIGYVLNPAGPDGNNGWYVSDVTLAWNVSEPESPNSLLKTGCDDQSITADQAATDYDCSATSAGGSAGPVTVSIKRDATEPTISGSASPSANGAGWNNEDVVVSFLCDDNLSGVATCGPDQTLSSDGANQSASGTATDNAGNSDTATVSGINIDQTKPTIVGSIAPVSPDGSNGWYVTAPTVTFNCDDSLSGVASCVVDGTSPASDFVTLGESASAQTVGGTATDVADNTEAASMSGMKVDLSDPMVACGATPTFMVGQLGNVTASVTDAISGPPAGSVSAPATNPNGGSVSLTGYDNAGRSSTISCPYHVIGATFMQPIDGRPTVNIAKLGRVIPVKVQIVYDGVPQTDVNTPAGAVTIGVASTSCTVTTSADDIEAYAAGASNTGLQFRWDSTGSFWIYNLDTSSFGMKASTCYQGSAYLNGTKAGYFFVKITK